MQRGAPPPPATGGKPLQHHREQQDDERRHHVDGHRYTEQRNERRHAIKRSAAPRRQRAQRNAHQAGQQQRKATNRQVHRQRFGDQLVHAAVTVVVGRAQTPPGQLSQVAQVLEGKRFVEVVVAFQRRAHLGLHGAIRIKRSTRRNAQHHERQRDDGQQSGHRGQQSRQRVTAHQCSDSRDKQDQKMSP